MESTYRENILELLAHGVFQVLSFSLSHLPAAEVEYFLREQLQNNHVVLTKALVGLRRSDDVRDERIPVLGPLAF